MKRSEVTPTGRAQPFEVNETFFSTTDPQGVITAGNEVFLRVSEYPLDAMLGQPHNLVRHPDMPRGVFRQLWRTVKAGKLFMGYVKNLTRTGNHYWVFAVVVPIPGGFLSVRFKPTSPWLHTVDELYRRLGQAEARAIDAGASESQAADASQDLLEGELRGLGHAAYETFSHAALNTEIKARDAEARQRNLPLFSAELGSGLPSANGRLHAIYRNLLAAYTELDVVFRDLDAFVATGERIRRHDAVVRGIVEEFRLNALNAHIAVSPLGQSGVTIGTVAQFLAFHGQSLARHITSLAGDIDGTSVAVAEVASNVSSARVQLEVLLQYVAEIAAHKERGSAASIEANARSLLAALIATLRNVDRPVAALQKTLPSIHGHRDQLRKDIIALQVAQIAGRTEVVRLPDTAGLQEMFANLRQQVETGKDELDGMADVVAQLMRLNASTPSRLAAVRGSLDRIPLEFTSGRDTAPDLESGVAESKPVSLPVRELLALPPRLGAAGRLRSAAVAGAIERST